MHRFIATAGAALATTLVVASSAWAHAHLSPSVTQAGHSEVYSLAVPTEKEGLTTKKIVLTLPTGFSIDSFVPTPDWKRDVQQTGSGDDAVIQKVTWTATGAGTPTDEDSLFQFLGLGSKAQTYTFDVEQTYSDGSIVDWSGPESAETPAPTIESKSSLGSSSSTLPLIGVVLGAIAVVLAGAALLGGRGGRQLA